jgi:hypothetical protein
MLKGEEVLGETGEDLDVDGGSGAGRGKEKGGLMRSRSRKAFHDDEGDRESDVERDSGEELVGGGSGNGFTGTGGRRTPIIGEAR